MALKDATTMDVPWNTPVRWYWVGTSVVLTESLGILVWIGMDLDCCGVEATLSYYQYLLLNERQKLE